MQEETGTPAATTPETGTTATGEPEQEAKTMALLAHLLGIFTSFVGPLIIWLIMKDKHAFVDDQGKEALNFQLTMLIGWIIGMILTIILIGILINLAVFIVVLIFGIIATIKASSGEAYRYPISIRMVK